MKVLLFAFISDFVLNIYKSKMITQYNEPANLLSFKLLDILKQELTILTSHNVIMFFSLYVTYFDDIKDGGLPSLINILW